MPLPSSVRTLVRNAPTVAPVPNRQLLSVTGSQAAEFLHGIVASSVPEQPQSHFYTAFLNAQGRVLYDAFCYATPSPKGTRGYIIEYDAGSPEAPPMLSMLKRYVLRAKVKLRDVSHEYDVWAAWGSEREKSWETERSWSFAASGAVEPSWDVARDGPPWGTEPGVLRDRRAIGMGHRLLIRKGDRPQEASTHDVATASDYLLHRILNGVPEGSVDIPPMDALPMDSNLDIMGALDFRKGCYVGQELTVRTYHTGQIRKRMLPVVIYPQNGSSDTLTDSSPLPSFPPGVNIRMKHTTTPTDDTPRPRPRTTGKLHSSINGVGLALLRSEHVAAVEKEDAALEFEIGENEKTKWTVTPWWPDWWPVSHD
ncbi:Aminomethyltransferase folate-binding domain-containing protein [Laetiporus sulphureus 93-53]|uniref:Aminomethyltransferase folate-binding domain-containing protein n=1 Tax=Laetiporus sulphureus 93-53 TaxID=1314785 RepID=A0A165IDQ5_9APHY|nr:Aminomethyltransferase folate-binding domain-containing protein [Laetiporus sulphureus 93-53]KZT12938.1 Aminomethyltransferase folate-binding domain-containing protein [Laetiporus sulphureus 93-53]